jgi:3-oxoacyl-ACP reductase-like protein
MLMCVIFGMGKVMHKEKKTAAAPAAAAPAAAAPAAAPAVKADPAPGTAGDFKLYNTDPRDAAMVMAIVADSLGKPLNELRFISIREVK